MQFIINHIFGLSSTLFSNSLNLTLNHFFSNLIIFHCYIKLESRAWFQSPLLNEFEKDSNFQQWKFPCHVPIFDGKSYDQCIVKMKVIFKYQDVLDIMNEGVPTLARIATDVQKVAHKDVKNKDGKTMFLIHRCMNGDIFEKIMHYENAKETWDTLEWLYS